MRPILLALALILGVPAAAHAQTNRPSDSITKFHNTERHERGGDGDGPDQGNDNDQRKCYRGQNCRGSFSPGPFDRSPIEMHDVCVSLDCSGREKKGKDEPAPPGDQPASLTNPSKLPMVVTQIIKSGLDLGQLFADGTIKFVEDLFVALA